MRYQLRFIQSTKQVIFSHLKSVHQPSPYYNVFKLRTTLARLSLSILILNSKEEDPKESDEEQDLLFEIPESNIDPRDAVLRFGGIKFGNGGFIGLKNGVTPRNLVDSILRLTYLGHNYTKKLVPDLKEDSYWFINETAYANWKLPDLSRNPEGKPQTVVTITEENIEYYIKTNEFKKGEHPESLLELNGKVTRIIADAFVTNVSEYKGQQVYMGTNGADAPSFLLIDPKRGIAAAVSCSWHVFCKGTIPMVIQAMVKLGAVPTEIKLLQGPGLGPNSYQFGDPKSFYDPSAIDPRDGLPYAGAKAKYAPQLSTEYFVPDPQNPGKVYVNQFNLIRDAAKDCGLKDENMFCSPLDTFTNPDKVFGARQTYPKMEVREQEALKYYNSVRRNINFFTITRPKQSKKDAVGFISYGTGLSR